MSDHQTVFLQINTVKYDVDREITNIYENLQIVWSHFFTDIVLFINIRSTSNIYCFIGIRIRCQRIQTNSYSVTFGYSQYLVQHSMNDPEGRKTTTHRYLHSGRHSATNPKTEGSIQCTTQRKEPGTVFTTLHLFRNIRISSSVTLHIAESPANNKHSSLLAQLLSYISFCIQGL